MIDLSYFFCLWFIDPSKIKIVVPLSEWHHLVAGMRSDHRFCTIADDPKVFEVAGIRFERGP